MKLTIDLQDPEIQRQLQLAMDEKISAMTAAAVERLMAPIIKEKLERMISPGFLQAAAKEMMKPSFTAPSYGVPSPFDALLGKLAREKLGM